jgi:hypothetical protein
MSSVDWAEHPLGPGGGPVDVKLNVSAYMSTVSAYDDSSCEATCNLTVMYEWIDPRLAGFEGHDLPEDVWIPELQIYGQLNAAEHGYGGERGSLSFKDRVSGTLYWMKVTRNIGYSCRKTHDISDFPFDEQIVNMFFSCGKTVEGATDRVRYTTDRDMLTFGPEGNRMERQAEWETVAVAFGLCRHASEVKSYDDAFVAMRRRRVPSWYLHKGLAPTVMCAVLSLAANVVPSDDIGDRFAILLTLLLTVFAVQWVTQDRLPRTPDLTYLDHVVNLVVYLILVSALASACFMLALRLGADPERIEMTELVYGGFCAFLVAVGVLKVLLRVRGSGGGGGPGYDWFTESNTMPSMMKKIEGSCFTCSVIAGNVQLDDVIAIPGAIDTEGRELNPLAANQVDTSSGGGGGGKGNMDDT